jgi:KDO II ethanolaminephosphotransferase
MNVAVFFRRLMVMLRVTIWKGLSGAVELMDLLVTFFLLRILSLFGRRVWRILATHRRTLSAAASYYMTFLNVVIGYGIIASVMTTDIDLSREVIGWHLILWLVLMSALPLVLIWSNRCRLPCCVKFVRPASG